MYTESEILFKESLQNHHRLLKEMHEKNIEYDEEWLIMRCNYGRALIGLERFKESEELLRHTYALFMSRNNNVNTAKDGLKVFSIGTLKCMDALATCLLLKNSNNDHIDGKTAASTPEEDALGEAEGLFRAIVATYTAKYGPTHRLTLRSNANLGE